MKRKAVFAIVVLGMLVAIVATSLRRDRRSPNQHWDQYWAVRQLDVWRLFGYELYAKNYLAVYDMTGRTTQDLPEPTLSSRLRDQCCDRASACRELPDEQPIQEGTCQNGQVEHLMRLNDALDDYRPA